MKRKKTRRSALIERSSITAEQDVRRRATPGAVWVPLQRCHEVPHIPPVCWQS